MDGQHVGPKIAQFPNAREDGCKMGSGFSILIHRFSYYTRLSYILVRVIIWSCTLLQHFTNNITFHTNNINNHYAHQRT